MKKYLFLLICFLGYKLYAQNDFVNGYYVDASGNMIQGFVKDMDWHNNPNQIKFRKTSSDETVILSIDEVMAFGDNAKQFKYVTKTVAIDKSSNRLEELSNQRQPEFIQQTVFLKVMVEGAASLYYYLYQNENKFFLSSKDNPEVEQLIYKDYKVSFDKVNTNEQYKQQLKVNLICDAVSSSRIATVSYNKNNLLKLFKQYNECKGENYTVYQYEKSKRKGEFHLSAKVGANFSSLDFEGTVNSNYNDDFQTKVGFNVGLELEYMLPLNNRKWSVFTNPSFIYFKETSVQDVASNNSYDLVMDINYNAIELPIGVRHYFYLNEDSRIYIDASYYFGQIGLNSNIDLTRIETARNIDIITNHNVGFGLGYRYKKIGVEARYFTSRDIFEDLQEYSSDFQNYALTLVYTIF